MSLGLLGRASCGCRCVIGIGGEGVVWDWGVALPVEVLVRVVAVLVRVVAGVVRERGDGTGPGSGGPKRLIFEGRASTGSSFLDFGTGPGSF